MLTLLAGLVSLMVATAPSSFAATLTFQTPAGWVVQKPGSSMRVAEFVLPKAAGEAEDASVIIYFFNGQGGSAQANIDRWIGQMTQPDGRPSKDVATTTTLSANGLAITLVDVSGTYVAETSPGSSDHFNKPGFRVCAAVVQTPGGPYYIKLLGPAKTVATWHESFVTFLKGLKFA